MKKSVGLLVILDGFGVSDSKEHNAVAKANMPVYQELLKSCPSTMIQASESHVGLPKGFMGSSEVGHLNIGAGRVVYQDFSLISHAIEQATFFQNPALIRLCHRLKERPKNALHLMGLVSDGGVHSHLSHLLALISLAKRQHVSRVFIHMFTDGRDTPPTSASAFLKTLMGFCKDAKTGEIATISGRFYAMDRDKRWERVEKAYRAIVHAETPCTFSDPEKYLFDQYQQSVTDEFIPPAVSQSYRGIADGDGVIFFNFRSDRARELTHCLVDDEFHYFKRDNSPNLCGMVTMTQYDHFKPVEAAFEKTKITNTLGEIVSSLGWKQLRIAETEKYAHVTYFFNGGDEKPFEGETRVLIPSPKDVRTYDLKPEMSARELTSCLLTELDSNTYQFVVVNFANPDMVGHTGNIAATIKALEVVDECLGKIVSWVHKHDAFCVLTSDHGNCETMVDAFGAPLTSHTVAPVPLIIIDNAKNSAKHHAKSSPKRTTSVHSGGKLCDIAPTILALWGLPQPSEMTGQSLV